MSLILIRLVTSVLFLLTLHPSPSAGRNGGDIYPAVPLAVRSPYINCWLHNNGNVSTSGQTWPTTFNHSQILGWSFLVRIDNLTYSFLGDVDSNLVNGTVDLRSTFFAIGPTYTLLSGHAGPMQVNLTFRNPIEPGDWVKQSIPFSYMSFTTSSSDNASHHVQVYSDVSAEWNSGDRTRQIQWSPTVSNNAVFHRVGLKNQENFTEILDQAEWGTLYYAMNNAGNVTYQAASDASSRGNFTVNGKLNNQQNSNVQFMSDRLSVFALSRDLGTIQATQNPVVFAIGYTTDIAINYTDLSGGTPKSRKPYYKIKYSNDTDLIVDFLNDFSNASSRADQVNAKTISDSGSVGVALGQMVFIALSELYGSMQLTIGTDASGNFNTSDVLMFMKNIGGVRKNRVNAVETLYAAFPALMYMDPSLGAPLLEPLFRLQASPHYTIGYAAPDLGSKYPTVLGSNSNHNQGVEQTGNMLIMTYAYARASGDGSLISRYYSVLTTWANYLNDFTLFISNQSSADGLTVNNQTNLAIKGIIAIKAMSEMSAVVSNTNDANKYSSAAARLYTQWRSHALGSDQHLLEAYGQSESSSWTLGYNLFADVWLGTNVVESSVYSGHSNFIYDLLSNPSFSQFGLPVDSTDTNIAVSSWNMFVVGMTKIGGLRSGLLSRVSDRSSNTGIPATVFSVYYDSANGTSLQGAASPAQGAVFAPMAVNVPAKSINPDSPLGTDSSSPKKKRNIGAIVGGVIGGVVAVIIVIRITTIVKRRRRRRGRPRSVLTFSTNVRESGQELIVTPFDPYSYESSAAQDSRILAEQQPLVSEAQIVAFRYLSSTPPAAVPLPQPETPVPIGLTDKEIARLRAEGFSSLTSRSNGASSSNLLESTPSSDAVPGEAGQSEAPFDPRRLYSEVESFVRREVERLHAEGMAIEAPPSYAEGDG